MSTMKRGSHGVWTAVVLAAGLVVSGCTGTSEAAESQLAANRELIEARYEAVNSHDWDRFQSFYAGSIVWDDPGLAEPVKGPLAVRQRLEAWTAAFPDLEWRLDGLFTQGELVCAEFTFVGTHEGRLPGPDGAELEPTNRRIQLDAVGVYRVQSGKIVESKIYFDFGELRTAGR